MYLIQRACRVVCIGIVFLSAMAPAQQWSKEPISQTIPGLWSIAMHDTGRGIAVGFASVGLSLSGVVRRVPSAMNWQTVPPSAFTPALSSGFTFWSGSSALRGSGTSWICGASGKIYKSTDYGVSWNEKTSGVSGSFTLFDIFFKNANEGMAVGSSGAAYYTTDGGNSWTSQNTGNGNNLYAVHSAGSIWYVSGANNTMLRFSPPSTWTDISVNLPSGVFAFIEGLQFLDDNTGTFSGYNSASQSHVFRTTNGGTSWFSFPSQPPISNTSYGIQFYSSVYFFTPNAGWVANVFDAIGYTSNGGITWATYSPSGTGTGALSKLDFINRERGWASGGALGGTGLEGFVLQYNGPPPYPNISTSVKSADFGTLSCDTVKEITYVVTNSGGDDLVIGPNSVTFSNPRIKLMSPSLPITILPGQQRDLTIRWTVSKTFSGMINGDSMLIMSNDIAHSPWVVSLSGQRAPGYVTFSDSVLNFPPICGAAFTDTSIIVTATGVTPSALVSFTWVSGDSGVVLTSPNFGETFTGQKTLSFRIYPKRLGYLFGTYKLVIGDSDCPIEKMIYFSVDHKTNDLTATPTTISFGDVCTGSSKDMAVRLRNIGNRYATVTSMEFVSGVDVFPRVYSTPFGPIDPDSTRDFTVRFSPSLSDTGFISAEYRLIVGQCPDTVYIRLEGRGVRSELVLSPSSPVLIGPVVIGQNAQQILALTNSGKTGVTIGSVVLRPPLPSLMLSNIPTLPYALAAGQTATATVRYAPVKLENISGTVCFYITSPCPDTLCVAFEASSSEPPEIVTRSALDLGLQSCRPAIRDSFIVRNIGKGPLQLAAFDISGAQKSHFRVLRPIPPASIAAGDSAHIIVEYNSSVEGASAATLTINHNDPKSLNQTAIALTGRRTVTEFLIEGDTLSPMSVCINDSVSRSFVIRNPGPRALDITSIRFASGNTGFTVTHGVIPATLQPNSSLPLTVRYRPTGSAVTKPILEIISQPCAYTVKIGLTGIPKRSEVVFAPSAIDFGTVTVGTPATRQVLIRNAGTEGITIQNIFFRIPHPALSIPSMPALPMTLSPGQERTVTLQYQPTAVGSLFSSLCVATTSPCRDTSCASVLGVARGEGLGFDRTDLAVTLDPCSNTGRCDTIRLENSAARTITITTIGIDRPDLCVITPPIATPFSLTGGQSRTIALCSQPSFTGTASATLTIQSDDAVRPSIQFPITVTRDSVSILASSTRLAFGDVARCELPLSRSLQLSNTGTAPDTITLTEVPRPPLSISNALPIVLNPGMTQDITFALDAAATGSISDTITFIESRCGTLLPVVVTATVHPAALRLTPDPIAFGTVNTGSSSTQTLTLSNLLPRDARIVAVRATGTADVSASASLPLDIAASGTSQIQLQYSPVSSGVLAATVCIVLDRPCTDTLCIAVTGNAVDTETPFFTSSPLTFAALAQCEELIHTDTLLNSSTQVVTLTGSSITGSGSAAYSILDPVTANEPLPAGGRRIFTVRFRPAAATDGTVSAVLSVRTSLPTAPEVTVPLIGTRVTQVMPVLAPLSFGVINPNTSEQRSFSVTNTGTAPFTIGTAALPAGMSLAPPLPVTIGPGQSQQFTLTLTASNSGALNESIVLHAIQPCRDSVNLAVSATVRPGAVLGSLSFGRVPTCAPSTASRMLRNTLAQDITVRGISISGIDPGAFAVVSPTAFPFTLRAGDSVAVTVQFQGTGTSERIYQANCDVEYSDQSGIRSVSSAVDASALRPPPVLVRPVDFGQVQTGTTSAPRRVVLLNDRGFTVRVSSVTPNDPALAVLSISPTLPAVLQAGDSLLIDVTFSPQAVRVLRTEGLTVTTDQPCADARDVPLAGAGVDNYAYYGLCVPDVEGIPDQRVRIAIRPCAPMGSHAVSSWTGALKFNRSMLYPLGLVREATLSADMAVTGTYDHANGEYRIVASGSMLRAGSDPLIIVECLVLIGDDSRSALALVPSFDFTSGSARVSSRGSGVFTLLGYCIGDGARLVRSASAFTLRQNAPNPFNPVTAIEYELPEDAFTQLIITDALGRTVATPVSGFQQAGVHRISFDAENLPSGPYLYTLQSGARQLTRTMIISK